MLTSVRLGDDWTENSEKHLIPSVVNAPLVVYHLFASVLVYVMEKFADRT